MPGALALCCQEVHDVDIDTSLLLAPRSANIISYTFSHSLLTLLLFVGSPLLTFSALSIVAEWFPQPLQ